MLNENETHNERQAMNEPLDWKIFKMVTVTVAAMAIAAMVLKFVTGGYILYDFMLTI